MGEVVSASAGRDEAREAAHQNSFSRLAQVEEHEPPGCAISRYDGELADVGEAALDRAASLGKMEGNTRHPDPIEPSLENRWHSVPPRREAQYQRLGGAKALDVILDPGEIIARLHIDRVLRQAEHGIKVRPIEVQFVNLMSLRSEAREYAVMDGRCETG